MKAPMEEQRKATIRERFSAASRAVVIGGAGSIIGTALLYRSYVRDRVSPPKKASADDIDWKAFGDKVMQAVTPVLAEFFTVATSAQEDHLHDEDCDCENPECGPRFDGTKDTLH